VEVSGQNCKEVEEVEDAADGDDLEVLGGGDYTHLHGNKMVGQLHTPEQQAGMCVFVFVAVVVVFVVAFELQLFLLVRLALEIQTW
jgi:hypothetical protein